MSRRLLVFLLLLVGPSLVQAQSYPATDSFSGNGALSSNWTNATPFGLSFPPVALVQSSGTVVPATSGAWGLALYTGATFTGDQYAQVVFVAHSTGGGRTGPCILMSLVGSGYCYSGDDGKIRGYSDSLVDTTPVTGCPIPASGDTIKLSFVGSTLTCTDVTTGVSVSGPASPGYYTTGMPGVFVDQNQSPVYALSAFQADCIPSCGTAPPTFSPVAGTYPSNQTLTVTISDATASATIHYTTDGTVPTASSPVYSAPFVVSTTETVNAYATSTGLPDSAVASALYTIAFPASTPTFGPIAGSYTSIQDVAITSTTAGAKIYYTVDGTTPTTSSTLYSTPIAVASTETINAIATATGSSASLVGTAAYTITLQPAATPTFSPGANTYTSIQTVAITDATAGAKIYYTLDGSTPTASSALYATPISVSASETIRAIAVATGYANSAVGSAAYTINLPPAATPVFSPAAGTYTSTQKVAITDSTSGAKIYYTLDGTAPTTNSALYSSMITVSSTETINAIAAATGYLNSAAGSALYTINLPTAATPMFSPVADTYTQTQSVSISTTTPSATIYYTLNGTTPTTGSAVYSTPITVSSSQTIEAIAVATDYLNSATGTAVYVLPVVTPTFNPIEGSYDKPQTVAINTASPGATIYYTTDGSTPTTGSAVYSIPIAVSAAETIQALAVAAGSPNSAVASAAYTFTAGTPTITPAPGAYTVPQHVTISTVTPNAAIYYTTDGATPTTASAVYSSPITVTPTAGNPTVTVNVLVTATGYANSTATAVYTYEPLTVTNVAISPSGTALQTGSTQPFTVTCTYSDATTDDCTKAGGATWSTAAVPVNSPALPTISVTQTGMLTAHEDPGAGGVGTHMVIVTAGGIADSAEVFIQHPGDTWYQYPTPSNTSGTAAVGSTITMGSGLSIDTASLASSPQPFQASCTWSSSNTAVATVDRHGQVTAVSPGPVIITCGRSGDAVFGTSAVGGWSVVAPGNILPLTVVAGGAGNTTWYVRPDGGTPYINDTATPYGQCNGTSDAPYPGTTNARWAPNTVYATGAVIIDLYGYYETAATGGTSSLLTAPFFACSVNEQAHNGCGIPGSTTSDGTVTWTRGSTYPVNQLCAMGNIRYLWSDENTWLQKQWMISGGDTVIVAQNAAGYNGNLDAPGGYVVPAGSAWLPANCAGDEGCDMPTIPSGTASQHTRILGVNAAPLTGNPESCRADSAKTLLNVSWAGGEAFNVTDSQFVDIACFEVSDKSACADQTNFSNVCHSSPDNYGDTGILESALASDVNYTDLFIHGLAFEGIHGPTGVGVVADHIHIRSAPEGGIDMDDAPWGGSNISVAGGLTMTNSTMEWTGCVEEYPVVHNYPYIECHDQSTGGYSDAFGTASTTGDWVFDHDVWAYNFQDGLDLAHSGMQNLTVTNSYSHANEGQAFKIGSGDNIIFQNNIAEANCFRIGQLIGDEPASAIDPGAPDSVGYGLCRANTNTIFHFTDNGTYVVQNNTFLTLPNADTPLGIQCELGWDTCKNANAIFQNNISMAYIDASSPNYDQNGYPGLFYLQSDGDNGNWGIPVNLPYSNGTTYMPPIDGWQTRTNNLYYNVRTVDHNYSPVLSWCPMPGNTRLGPLYGTNESCNTQDPLFVGEAALPASTTLTSEAQLDGYDFTPSPNSPVIGAGIALPGFKTAYGVVIPAVTTDMTGATRPNPPSLGALEPAAGGPSKSTSTTTLTTSPTSAIVGQSVLLTATVTGSGTPTGSIIFYNGSTALNSQPATLVNGVATYSTTSLPSGSNSLTAVYSGDTTFAGSTSLAVDEEVGTTPPPPVATTTALASSLNPANVGDSVVLTATVTPASGTATMTGTVTFYSGATSLGTGNVTSGVATLTTSFTTAGSYVLTAVYGGDTNFTASPASPSLTEVVNAVTVPPITTTTALAVSPNPANIGDTVTLTATVKPASGTATMTGAVTFYNGSTSLGTGNVTGGVATLTTALSPAGSFIFTAVYGGDTNFAASPASPPVTEVVNASGPPNFSLSFPGVSLNVSPNATGLIATTVTPTGGYTGTVHLSCATSSPEIGCSLSPPTLTLTSASAIKPPTSTLSVTATQTASVQHPALFGGSGSLALALLLPGSLLGLFGLRRRGYGKSLGRLTLLLLLSAGAIGAASLTGCGGSSGAIPQGRSYTVTVTANDGVAAPVTSTINVFVK